MKLTWETSKISDFSYFAECGPIELNVDLGITADDDITGWYFWIEETGQESDDNFSSKEEAMEAAEKFAESIARDIMQALA